MGRAVRVVRSRQSAIGWSLSALFAVAVTVGIPSSVAATDGTLLSLHGFDSMVIDETHQHVFVTGGGTNTSVVVVNYDGSVAKTITGVQGAAGMVLEGETLYVAQEGQAKIAKIDTAALSQVGTIDLGATTNGDLTLVGDRLWFSGNCNSGPQIGSIDLTTEQVATHTEYAFPCQGVFAGSPIGADLVIAAGPDLYRYDVSTTEPVREAYAFLEGNASDAVVTPDGQSVLRASGVPYEIEQFRVSNFAGETTYPTGPYPVAVDVSDAGYVVAGVNASYDPDVISFALGDPDPVDSFDFHSTQLIVQPAGVRVTADAKRVFVATEGDSYTDVLFHVIDGPGLGRSALTVSVSRARISYGDSILVTADLGGFRQTSNHVVKIYRRYVGGGAVLLRSGTIDSHGKLSVRFEPSKIGTVWAEWAGDDAHRAAISDERTVHVAVVATARMRAADSREGRDHLYESGHAPIFVGRVRPNHAGDTLRVILQARVHRRWHRAGAEGFDLAACSCVGLIFRRIDEGIPFRIRGHFVYDGDHNGDRSPWQYFEVLG